MIYYGIVNNLKEEDKGIYGAKGNLVGKVMGYSPTTYALSGIGNAFGYEGFDEMQKLFQGSLNKITIDQIRKRKRNHIETLCINENTIILSNSILNGSYNISNNLNLFYGLFDDSLLKSKAFKKIMKSYGGSDFIILEKNDLPKNKKHFGGEKAVFSSGIYISHPKNQDILIPLINSNDLIRKLILKEIITAYEALGAKKITIIDVTDYKLQGKFKKQEVEVGVNGNLNKKILREKHFEPGTYSPERALNNKTFIYDIPEIMTTIDSRINGNQRIEKFSEKINLNLGIDTNVLNLFKANINFEYNQEWSFDIEFYPKK
jgi:hypothetical protein